mgnify:CR=1 FL=1
MSCIHNERLLEQWYEEALAETLKEYKDVAKAEEEAEKIARERLESESLSSNIGDLFEELEEFGYFTTMERESL